MENFLKDKRIEGALGAISLLALVISVFFIIKIVGEIKAFNHIGRENYPTNTITVAGKGEVTAVSNIASLTINLNKEGKTAKEAQDLLNESITKTLTYLKDQKVEDKDVKSEYGGISPKYSYEQACYAYPCPTKDPKIVAYTATQTITVKVREVDNASVIRTGLAEIGVTDINGPTFSIDDEEKLKDEARSKAIAQAKEKAKVLAKDLGVKLGDITTFYENNGGYPMYASTKSAVMEASGIMMDSRVAPTLPKGENKIISNITITYEIK